MRSDLLIDCKKIPINCNKSSCKMSQKKCKRSKDGKIFSVPRKYSRKQCKTIKMGFTQKSSCAAYE